MFALGVKRFVAVAGFVSLFVLPLAACGGGGGGGGGRNHHAARDPAGDASASASASATSAAAASSSAPTSAGRELGRVPPELWCGQHRRDVGLEQRGYG